MKLIRPQPEVRGPTPETKAKAAEGVVGLLVKRKFIWPEHVTAAFLIESGHNLINDEVGWKLMKFEERGYDLSKKPAMDLPGRLARIVIFYTRWVDEISRRRARALYGLTIDIAHEGRRLRETERKYGIENGTAKQHFRRSLDIYCQEAGMQNMGLI